MQNWFNTNPNPDAGFLQRSMFNTHTWGRQQFAKSYARRGIAATMFAPNRKEMMLNPWRPKLSEGSPKYMARLRELQSLHPKSKGIQKAISGAAAGKSGVFRKLGGGALGAAMIALPAFTEDGPIHEKARAVTKGVGAAVGFTAGAKAGAGIGAVVGSFVPFGIGSAIGAAAGGLIGGIAGSFAGEEATDFLTRIPDRLVDKERSRRGLEWGQHKAAFQTQRAHTMRQQSLSLMNRGSMSSRSLLGQEAVFVHR